MMSSLTIKMAISLAKITVELRGRTAGRSLMKAENRVGPRIEPWGTREELGKAWGGVGVKDTGNLGAIGELRLEPRSGSGGKT